MKAPQTAKRLPIRYENMGNKSQYWFGLIPKFQAVIRLLTGTDVCAHCEKWSGP